MSSINSGNISGSGNTQWNKKLAEELDAADGKKDGKISVSVWNGFIKHTGGNGNEIKCSIGVDNASKSFNYYDTKKDTGKVNWNDWESMYNSYTGKKVSSDETPVNPTGLTAVPAVNTDTSSNGDASSAVDTSDKRPGTDVVDMETIKQGALPPRGKKATKYLTGQEETTDKDGNRVITYTYNFGKGDIFGKKSYHDTQTFKENKDGSLTVTDAVESIGGNMEVTKIKYTKNPDGSITGEIFDDDGNKDKSIIYKDGHIIRRSDFATGANSGKEIETRRNYFADGSIEKIVFVDGEKMGVGFYDGEGHTLDEVRFWVKNSPLKIPDGKMPSEADLLKAGYKKDTDSMTTYHNEQTGESVVVDTKSGKCKYTKGNIIQRNSYDKDGNLVSGRIDIKGKDGAFETYRYEKDEDIHEIVKSDEYIHPAPSAPEDFVLDVLEDRGFEGKIKEFKKELNIPDSLMIGSDIKEGAHENISPDGNYKQRVNVDSNGNLTVTYSKKQDGTFKQIGSYTLNKYDSPNSLRGYDYRFKSLNNLTGSSSIIPCVSWKDSSYTDLLIIK